MTNKDDLFLRSTKQSLKLCLVTVLLLFLATSICHAQTPSHTHPVCGATCTDGENHTDNLTWEPVTAADINTKLKTSGNYYLAEDIQLNAQIDITTQNANVHLCLNGHVLKAQQGERVLRTDVNKNVVLTICDCQPQNTEGTLSASRALTSPVDNSQINITGGLITGGNKSGIMLNDATLDLYGGTIGGNNFTSTNGGAICLGIATFTMHAGTICCNTAKSTSGSGLGGDGGGIGFYAMMESNTLHLKGGTISHNKAARNGGGISLSASNNSSQSISLSGNAIVEHNSAEYGGGIHCINVIFDMTGGFIRNNRTQRSGGGIHLAGSQATLTGGEITGNKSERGADANANIYYRSGAGIFYNANSYNNSYFKISGAPLISGNTNHEHADNLFIQDPITIGGPLTNRTPIKISYNDVNVNGHGTPKNFTIGWSTHMGDKKPSDYFESNDEGIYVLPFTDKDKTEGRMGVGYTFTYNLPGDVKDAEDASKAQPYYGDGDQVKLIFPKNMTRPGYTFDNEWRYGNNTYTESAPYYTIVGIPGIALHPTWKLKKPTLVTTPKSPVLISKEESTSLTAQASHELESGVTYEYEWYTCNSDKASPMRVSLNNTYTINKNTAVGTYHYYCKVKAYYDAEWSEYAESDVITVHVGYTVTFDPADGTTPTKLNVIAGETVGDQLPAVTTTGFAGWYTSNGTEFTKTTPVTQDATVTAKYKYAISTEITHGTVSFSPQSPVFAKEKVTLVLTPDLGYHLADNTLKVYKTGDKATLIEVTDNTFVMPMYPVTIYAEFELDKLNLALVTDADNLFISQKEAGWFYRLTENAVETKSLSLDTDIPFNGTLSGTLAGDKTLSFEPTCKGELTFDNVTVPTLVIQSGASVVLSDTSELTYTSINNNGGSLVAREGATITNTVTGQVKMNKLTITAPQNGILAVRVGDVAIASGDMLAVDTKFSVTATPASGYQTESLSVKTASGDVTATNGLYAMPDAEVTVSATFKRTYVPPVPVYYTITLPKVEGAITNPQAGEYSREEGYSFSFSLNLEAGYEQSVPVVTANGVVLTARASDGKYIIQSIMADTQIKIDGVVRNTPTGNAEIENDAIRVRGSVGALLISTPHPSSLEVYTISGNRLRHLNISAGDSQIELPAGLYIIRMDDHRQKVFIW